MRQNEIQKEEHRISGEAALLNAALQRAAADATGSSDHAFFRETQYCPKRDCWITRTPFDQVCEWAQEEEDDARQPGSLAWFCALLDLDIFLVKKKFKEWIEQGLAVKQQKRL